MVANCTVDYGNKATRSTLVKLITFFSGKMGIQHFKVGYQKSITNKPAMTNIRWGKKRDNSPLLEKFI